MSTTSRRLTLAGFAAAVALTVAACGSDSGSSSSATTKAPTDTQAPVTTMAPDTAMTPDTTAAAGSGMSDEFGPACGQVPADGAGSFAGMAMDPVATAASNNPLLSTLVSAVQAAGLVDTLNSAQGITVFAPINDAFAKVDKATLEGALADPKGLLTKVLTYHVVGEKVTPEMLANGTFTTLEGDTVTTSGSGDDFKVNGSASVVCGNVQTGNATVYLIDGVLLPTS